MDREPLADHRPPVPWFEGIPVAITVTDADGVIVRMNARSRETFAADGGGALVGRNVLDCHPEAAREKVRALLEQQRPNHSTISKGGATQDHPPAAVVPGRALRRPRGDRGPDPRRAAPLRPRVAASLAPLCLQRAEDGSGPRVSRPRRAHALRWLRGYVPC